MTASSWKWHVKYWTRTNSSVEEVRRRAMLYFGKEALSEMALVAREPDRLLFSDPSGDLVVRVDAGRPNAVSVVTSHWPAQAQEFLGKLASGENGIIHYETESDHPAPEILHRARDFFGAGPTGLGLALTGEQPQRLTFAGGGGQVTVNVRGDGRPVVEVAAREWTYHAEEFARQVSSEH